MLGRAARDIELPEAILFTIGNPENAPAIRDKLATLPVSLLSEGARNIDRLLELAKLYAQDKKTGAKVANVVWCCTFAALQIKNKV